MFLLAVAAIGGAAVLAFANLAAAARLAEPAVATETVVALLTGIAAVVAAFHLSLPDRSPRWALLPLPPALAWVASSGAECYADWVRNGAEGWEFGATFVCFRFIVAAGLPLGIALTFALRRAKPLEPVRVAAIGGLGVAALAAVLLQFFHPFDITFIDLGAHAAAIAVVVGVTSLTARLTERRGAAA